MKKIKELFSWVGIKSAHRLMFVIVLTLGTLSFLWGEKVTAGGGLGWDGVNYANMVRNLDSMIANEELSSYYTQRILPSAIVRGLLMVSSAEMSNINIIQGFELYNLALLLMACWVWKRLADNFSLSVSGRWIGFAGIFINFQCSKQAFYYPVLTDVTALFIGLLLLLFYIEKKKMSLFFTTIVGAFCWPIVSISGALLLLFLKSDLPTPVITPLTAEDKGRFIFQKAALKPIFITCLIISLVGWMLLTLVTSLPGSVCSAFNSYLSSFTGYLPQNLANLADGLLARHACLLEKLVPYMQQFLTAIPSLLAVLIALAFILGSWTFLPAMFHSMKRISWTLILLAIGALLVPALIVKAVANPALPNANGLYIMAKLILLPQSGKFFLAFISLAVFWGPIFLLMLLKWQAFCIQTRKLGVGVVAVISITLLLGLAGEPRFFTIGWPFIVFTVVLLLENLAVKASFKYLLLALTVLSAQFWLPLNLVPWVGYDYEGLQDFPKQLYFMHYGLWMGWWAFLLQFIAIVISLYFLKRAFRPQI